MQEIPSVTYDLLRKVRSLQKFAMFVTNIAIIDKSCILGNFVRLIWLIWQWRSTLTLA